MKIVSKFSKMELGNNINVILDYNAVCRTCLSTRNLQPILSTDSDVSISEKLEACASIKIDQGDFLSRNICGKCVEDLERFYDFKIKCEQINLLLLKHHNNLMKLEENLDLKNDSDAEYCIDPLAETKDEKEETLIQIRSPKSEQFDSGEEEDPLAFNSNNNDLEVVENPILKPKLSTANRYTDYSKTHVQCKTCNKILRRSSAYTHLLTHTPMERDYKCKLCDKGFSSNKILTRHFITHSDKQPWTCKECQKSFFSSANLQRHLLTHTGERPWVCTLCDKAYSQAGTLKLHMKSHTDGSPYRCKECDQGFMHLNDLQSHMETHTDNPHQCRQCGKIFLRASTLRFHLKNHETENTSFKCSKCDSCFKTRLRLKIHEAIHGPKTYLCGECGKSFRSNFTLMSHLRQHEGIKDFKCEFCQKGFVQKAALIAHMRVHTGEKPYSCDECDRRFSQIGHLQTHKKTHTGVKDFKCEFCGREFACKGNLTAHKRLHTGEKPYECPGCKKLFSFSNNMKKHISTCSGVSVSNTISYIDTVNS